MTEVSFYTFADNTLDVARKLAAQAFARGLHVLIHTRDAAQALSLDALLWTTPAHGFLPHCRDDHALAAVTPILIGDNVEALDKTDVIINLDHERPAAFARFTRLLEIIGTDTGDVEHGRQRYRFYRERGYALATIDLRNSAQ
jgi:DNA polymerase-3 subunit chi